MNISSSLSKRGKKPFVLSSANATAQWHSHGGVGGGMGDLPHSFALWNCSTPRQLQRQSRGTTLQSSFWRSSYKKARLYFSLPPRWQPRSRRWQPQCNAKGFLACECTAYLISGPQFTALCSVYAEVFLPQKAHFLGAEEAGRPNCPSFPSTQAVSEKLECMDLQRT